MGKGIRGITVEIGGDTTKLGNALAGINTKTKDLQSELKGVNTLLKMDPGNVTLLAQKQELLSEAIKETTDKLKLLKDSQEQVQKQFENGEIGADQYRDFQREIIATEKKLQSLTSELESVDDTISNIDKVGNSVEDLGDKAEDSSDGFTVMKGALADMVSNGIQNAIGAVGDLVGQLFELTEATQEFRSMQGKLTGSAESFGYSAEFASDKFQEFYKYMGDEMGATNAITNLMGVGTSVESVSKLAEGAIGVWASYGDSIPIESLTESINETIQVGKVTGTFADTINWAKTSNEQLKAALDGNSSALSAFNKAIKDGETAEDAFNMALEKTTSAQERADIIAKFLNSTYGESKKTYDEMNGSITSANEAQLRLTETQARLGETMAPVNAAITNLKTQALETLAPVIESVVTGLTNLVTRLKENPVAMGILIGVVTALTTAFVIFAGSLLITGLINAVTVAIGALGTAFTILTSPISLIVIAIAGLVAAFIYLWNNCESFRNFFINLWENIKNATAVAIDWIVEKGKAIGSFFTVTIPAWFNTCINWVKTNWQSILAFLINPFSALFSYFYNNNTKFKEFVDNAVNAIKQLPGKIGTWLTQTINNVATWGSNLASKGKQAATNMFNAVVNTVKTLPSKMLSIGKDLLTGLWNGIGNKVEWLKGKVKGVVDKIKGWFTGKDGFDTHSPSLWSKGIGINIDEGLAQGIDKGKDEVLDSIEGLIKDTRSEVKKVTDEMNKTLLDSEIKYAKESERLKDSKKQKDKDYLEKLKENAETERKLYDAKIKDIENLKTKVVDAYKSISKEAFDSIADLENQQNAFANKLKGYGDLLTDVTIKFMDQEYKYSILSDLDSQTETLTKYYDLLTQIKERSNVPQEFFTMMRDMSVEEGIEFSEVLLRASDEDFNKYIADWQEKQRVSQEIAKQLYKDEAEALATEINNKFATVEEEFFGVGSNSADQFEDGFMTQLGGIISNIRASLQSAFSGLVSSMGASVTAISVNANNPPQMATGGIVNRSTIVEVGENGREAIIPLERNTGWINEIARRLNSASVNNTGSDPAMLDKLDRIYERLDRMKIVLDSGVLVGETIDKIDAGLASNQLLKARGL